MNELEAIELLKSMGYVVSPPPTKQEMLQLLTRVCDWYNEDMDMGARGRAVYAAIEQLIKEHAQ